MEARALRPRATGPRTPGAQPCTLPEQPRAGCGPAVRGGADLLTTTSVREWFHVRLAAAAPRSPPCAEDARAQARCSGRRSLPRGPLMFAGAVATVATLAGGVFATTTLVSNTNPFAAGSNVDAGCDTDVKG